MVFIKLPDTLWNREYGDKARLLQFRRALKEGNKPSRWYYDNPADKGSAYRRRYVAALEIAADIIENSPCDGAFRALTPSGGASLSGRRKRV
jgi:hypothetical protein